MEKSKRALSVRVMEELHPLSNRSQKRLHLQTGLAPEMIARVRAVLRRSGTTIDAPLALLQFGRLEIDEAAREARVDGVDVRLKPREFALLLELATNVGIALSRERLLERVWGFDFDGDERTVDVHVRRLRAKIEEEAKLPPMVQTIHGFGYKFVRV